jgi:hypothetical protein
MSTAAELSENSHQGFESAKRMLGLASMQVKSNTVLGMPVCLRQNVRGSRSFSQERDAYTRHNPSQTMPDTNLMSLC